MYNIQELEDETTGCFVPKSVSKKSKLEENPISEEKRKVLLVEKKTPHRRISTNYS